PESIAKAQAELGSEVLVLRADSASIDAQKELAQAVQTHYGQPDVAFLNAGVSVWLPIEEWTEEMFDRSFDINVKGPYFLIQALLPVFANPASVVLNTSVSA
ncbi:short-chain dehydrogenase, partial [Pseudomonas sp. FW305-BF6]|uniref:SDR family oxidoreductase n=1 Tax=Pseudomonas sp. FW305-BF6 TaxID=2070673 RepID=UPI000CA7240A